MSVVRDVGRRNGTLLGEGNEEKRSITGENACSKNETAGHRWLRSSDGANVVFAGNEAEANEGDFRRRRHDLGIRAGEMKGILIIRACVSDC